MADIKRNIESDFTLRDKIIFGAMGSVTGIGSILAASCASRCNGCMGCAAGGAGIAGMLVVAKIAGRFSKKDCNRNHMSNNQNRGMKG